MPAPSPPTCPECGAPRTAEDKCWLCQAVLPASQAASAAVPAEARAPMAFQFGLDTLFLATTLAAVFAGLFTVAPGLALLGLVLTTPALVRTTVLSNKKRHQGERMTAGEKSLRFVETTGITVGLLVAAGVAFYATCWAGFIAGAAGSQPFVSRGFLVGIAAGFTLGIETGIVAGVWTVWGIGKRFGWWNVWLATVMQYLALVAAGWGFFYFPAIVSKWQGGSEEIVIAFYLALGGLVLGLWCLRHTRSLVASLAVGAGGAPVIVFMVWLLAGVPSARVDKFWALLAGFGLAAALTTVCRRWVRPALE